MIGIFAGRMMKHALRNFRRNIWLTLATTVIMTLTLTMMLSLYFINVLGSEVLRSIEQKVDLSAIFKDETTEQQIATVVDDVGSRVDVEEVRIVSSEEALTQFRRRHADDPFIEESLRELEDNPLPTSMFVVATEPRFYQNIAKQLESEQYAPYIEKVNFANSKVVIDRLIAVMTGVRNVGFITTIVLAALVILIMFNTIRLAIYSFREEIDIMRLVGASNWFIRGPFIIEAIFVALLSVVVTTAIAYPVLRTVAPEIDNFFFSGQGTNFDIYQYAITNWPALIGLQLAVAVGLAVISSFIAIRRYLR